MTEHRDSSSADAELSVLMPESSAGRALRRPTRPLASKERRHNDNRSEREYAALDDQVGVARSARGPVDLKQAEFAVVVVDPGQHRGIGNALTERLDTRARRAGVDGAGTVDLSGRLSDMRGAAPL